MRNAGVATHSRGPSKGALGADLPYHLHQYRSWWPSCLKCPGPIPPVTASERGQRCITSHTRKGILPIRRKHPVPHLHLQATSLTLRSISTRPPPASRQATPGPILIFLLCLVATDWPTGLQQPHVQAKALARSSIRLLRLPVQGVWTWKRVLPALRTALSTPPLPARVHAARWFQRGMKLSN